MVSTNMAMTIIPSEFQLLGFSRCFSARNLISRCDLAPRRVNFLGGQRQNFCKRLPFSCNPYEARLIYAPKPIFAAASGLEASITDPEDNLITLKEAKINVESQEENKIQLRVDLTANDTQKIFDKVLINLARTAPPIPGFRREKGGKTSKVPKSFLLQILGEERVTKFVIQEIVSSTMADYVKKENLNVKDKKVNTTQTAEELKMVFTPGKEFGFNVVLELEKSETEISSSSSSDI